MIYTLFLKGATLAGIKLVWSMLPEIMHMAQVIKTYFPLMAFRFRETLQCAYIRTLTSYQGRMHLQ